MEQDKIYFVKGNEAKTLNELIFSLYLLNTISRYKAVTTFHDKACTRQQCRPAYRSFSDILIIANTYFPGTTEVELLKFLYTLVQQGGHLRSLYCHNISRIVFIPAFGINKNWCELHLWENYPDSRQYIDKYTFEYLDNIIKTF